MVHVVYRAGQAVSVGRFTVSALGPEQPPHGTMTYASLPPGRGSRRMPVEGTRPIGGYCLSESSFASLPLLPNRPETAPNLPSFELTVMSCSRK